MQRRPLVVWAAARLRADAQRVAGVRASEVAAQLPLWCFQRRVWMDAGIGVACAGVAVCSDPGAVLAVHCFLQV